MRISGNRTKIQLCAHISCINRRGYHSTSHDNMPSMPSSARISPHFGCARLPRFFGSVTGVEHKKKVEDPDQGLFLAIIMATTPSTIAITSAATATYVIVFTEPCNESISLANVSKVSLWFCIALKLSTTRS